MNCDEMTHHYLDLVQQLQFDPAGRQRLLDELPQIRLVLDYLQSQEEGGRGLKLAYHLRLLWLQEPNVAEGVHWLNIFLALPYPFARDDLQTASQALLKALIARQQATRQA